MINQVFHFRDATLAYECSGGTGTLELYSDMPGDVMALRATIELPATSGRQVIPANLNFKGRMYKPKAIPPAGGDMSLYAGTMHVKRIGLYLDGTKGETWETEPIALNI